MRISLLRRLGRRPLLGAGAWAPRLRPRLTAALAPTLAAALLLAGLVAGCAKGAVVEPLQLRALDGGLEYGRVAARYGGGPPVATHVLRLDLTRWALRHVTPKQTGARLSDAAGFRRAAGPRAAAAFNGIYFDPSYKPLGLMVSAGVQLSRLRRVDHGVFTVAVAGPGLQHARSWRQPKDLDFAAECGPRLVVEGRPLDFKPGLARRTALGYDGRGRVLVIVTDGVVALADFTAFLARAEAKGGLGVVGSLNLDGGSSTMFDLAWGGTKAAVRSAVLVPAGIAVVKR